MSELAVPVEVDGVRIGVLNLESKVPDAFSAGHLEVMHWFAEKAGRLYGATDERRRRSVLLDQRAIPGEVFQMLQALFGRLTTLQPNRAHSETPLGVLVYTADYLYGKLDAQNPTLIGFAECRESPSFLFGENASLVAAVFSKGAPLWFADSQQAIKDGRISPLFDKGLRLSGAVLGFPVIVQGHIAGVISVWRADGEKACLDGRDIELMRRAAHLATNAYIHPLEQKRALPGLELTLRIERLFGATSKRVPLPRQVTSEYLRESIFPVLKGYLQILSNLEDKFRAMLDHNSTPTEWICPTRCRLWLRIDDPTSDMPPQFLLVVQVSLKSENSYQTHFAGDNSAKPTRIASETFPRFTKSTSRDGTAERQKTSPELIEVRQWIGPEPDKANLFRNNPHQSFLMSRLRADRFARVQRPNLLGEDILSKILGKGKSRPWFVAPIIRSEASEWSQDQFTAKRSIEDLEEQRLLGYLTVDEAIQDAHGREITDPMPPQEGWLALQNTILSALDLFSACLATALAL